jgi:hypothetical protein
MSVRDESTFFLGTLHLLAKVCIQGKLVVVEWGFLGVGNHKHFSTPMPRAGRLSPRPRQESRKAIC